MYRCILVPLDGSPFSEHALPLALGLAWRAGAAVQLVHVHVPASLSASGAELAVDFALDAELRRQERAYLDDVVRRAAAAVPVPVTAALLDGPVAEGLTAHATATGCGLVVMTTHGRGPFRRFWLGSVADRLVRRAPVPLLLVRPRQGTPDLTAEPDLRHIVIPLDGSPLAEQVLGAAVELGKLLGADYTLLHVMEPLTPFGLDLAGEPARALGRPLVEQLRTWQDDRRREALGYLDNVAQRLRKKSLPVQTRVVVGEQPAATVLDSVPGDAGLVALATHGRRGLARLFLGGVADKVVRGAAGPVLVYRPTTAPLTEASHERSRHAADRPAADAPGPDGGRADDAEPDLDPGCCHGQGRPAHAH